MYNIDEMIKTALKAGNKDELKTFRNFKAEILKYKTSGANKNITEEIQIQILKSMIKNLKKSEEAYLQASRQDLVDECIVERHLLENLIPKPADLEFVKLALVECPEVEFDSSTEIIKISKKNMGTVIKSLKNQFPNNDGAEIAKLVKKWVY